MPQYCIELGCGKTSSYGYPGGGRLTCKEHHLYGMEDVKNKKCEDFNVCGNFAQRGLDGLCISCARKNGWDGVYNECKDKCGKQAINGLNGLCLSCYNVKHGIVKNPGENMFKNYLKEKFPEFCSKTEFSLLTYRIDFLIELEELFIAIEHDEKQHKDSRNYPPEQEAKREEEILAELTKKKRSVIIRFNPNNYRVGGRLMKTPLEERFEKLGKFIEECISDKTKSGIFRLFYNE